MPTPLFPGGRGCLKLRLAPRVDPSALGGVGSRKTLRLSQVSGQFHVLVCGAELFPGPKDARRVGLHRQAQCPAAPSGLWWRFPSLPGRLRPRVGPAQDCTFPTTHQVSPTPGQGKARNGVTKCVFWAGGTWVRPAQTQSPWCCSRSLLGGLGAGVSAERPAGGAVGPSLSALPGQCVEF